MKDSQSSLENVDPLDIEVLHAVNRQGFFNDLVASMVNEGWQGRPVLAIEADSGELVAWTGSHRIAAAIEAGLDVVPCLILPESAIKTQSISAHVGHVMDHERFEAIVGSGDEDAIVLMNAEGRM